MKSVKILHLDTSSKACSVGLSENGVLIALEETHDDHYAHSEKLVTLVTLCLQNSQWKLEDLSAVGVASGPGSYTGLRIGVSYAKGLCYALNIPLLSLDSLTALYHEIYPLYPHLPHLIAMDARRMEVYAKVFDSDRNCVQGAEALVVDERTFSKFPRLVVSGDANQKLQEIWSDRNYVFSDEKFFGVSGQVNTIYQKFLEGEWEDLAYFEPEYLKPFFTPAPKK